tara:strand:- start:342 stop:833 length:492 start_codon:yes stop_codon:yes gene_type:complete
MSIYYPLNRLEECLPTEYEEEWTDDTLFEKPRILNIEFYKLLGTAIEASKIKIYSKAGRLIAPSARGHSLKQYINRKEFNDWLKENGLPYSLSPAKTKPQTLAELKESGALRTDCIDIVDDLKARGFPKERIDKRKVATELSKTLKYNRYKKDTIFQRIRCYW